MAMPNLSVLSDADLQRFVDIATDLSPENLTCDGEAPIAFVRQRRAELVRNWKQLEKRLGVQIEVDDVWSEWERRSRAAPNL